MRPPRWDGAAITAGCMAILATTIAVPTASASDPQDQGTSTSASVALSIPVTGGVRSVTVSPDAMTYGNCADAGGVATTGLVLPHGTCSTAAVTVTNGPIPGHIDVSGADAAPSDGGTGWSLVAGAVGADQYRESLRTASGGGGSVLLKPALTCDRAFDGPGCAATAGQTGSETLSILGPTTTTDTSSTFTTTVTWTAVP